MIERDIVKRLRQRDEYDAMLDHENRVYGLAKSLEHEAADEIERLRDALDAAGLAVVPKEPTPAMLDAAQRACPSFGRPHAIQWRAMLAAAKETGHD